MSRESVLGYKFGPFYLDVAGRVLLHQGVITSLQPKAIETLLLLIENRGAVVTRERILEHVWPGTFVQEANVSQNIWALRKVLVRDGYPDPIETVSRRGYMFSAEVQLNAGDAPVPGRGSLLPQKGRTLAAQLQSGPFGLEKALHLAAEIAEVIEQVHSSGAVHGGIAPSAIAFTGNGDVTLLVGPDGLGPDARDYVSPEQAAGEPCDARSDIFSFGVVLCEMITGKHPFRRENSLATAASILRDVPVIAHPEGRALAPGPLMLLRRLLAKSPRDRYESMAQVRLDLARLSSDSALAQPDSPPPASAPRGRLPLIGRDAEKTALLRKLDDALAGHGSLILAGGEPGVGKTRLGEEILAEARKRGFVALSGHCYEMEGAPPYIPFIEILGKCARLAPPATFLQALGDGAPEVARLVPELRRMFPEIPAAIELPPEQQRRFLFNAYREFVERACAISPMMVVFEDMHWADESSLLLLAHIAQNIGSIPGLVLVTYRDNELNGNRPFPRTLELLLRSGPATAITLRPLTPAAVGSLLTAITGNSPPPSAARIIFSLTEGNPFFVEELVRYLVEEGRLFDSSGRWRVGSGLEQIELPQTIRFVLGRRLQRLGVNTLRLLATAAVIGRSFDLRLLEKIECCDSGDVLPALEEAEEARLLAPRAEGRGVRYSFAHELIRQVLAERISLPRRQRLHARIADAIEQLYPAAPHEQAPAIAHHLYEAGFSAEAERTIGYLVTAAAQASSAAAHEDALAHLDRALSLRETAEPTSDTVRSPTAIELRTLRAGALRSLGRAEEAIADYERAVGLCESAGDFARASRISEALAWVYFWTVNLRAGLARVRNTLAKVGGADPYLQCRMTFLEALMLSMSGNATDGLRAFERGRAMQRELPGIELQVVAGQVETHLRLHIADLTGSAAAARDVEPLLAAAGDLWNKTDVTSFPATTAMFCGQPVEAEARARRVLPEAERIGHQNVAWICRLLITGGRMAAGDLDGAWRAAHDALAFGKLVPQCAWTFLDENALANIAYRRGDRKEALLHHNRAVETEPAFFGAGIAKASLFAFLAREGDPRADDVLAAALPGLPMAGRPNSFGSWGGLATVIDGLDALGRHKDLARLLPAAEDMVRTGIWCFQAISSMASSAGMAAAAAREWTRAEDHHTTAIHQADTAPYRLVQPAVRERYAEMLLARGARDDRVRARELLDNARTQYESLGMAEFARRASDGAASIGLLALGGTAR